MSIKYCVYRLSSFIYIIQSRRTCVVCMNVRCFLILIVPGFAGSLACWEPFLHELPGSVLHQPNRTVGPWPRAQAQQLQSQITAETIVIAHSLGSIVATHATYATKAKRLILLCPAGLYAQNNWQFLRGFYQMANSPDKKFNELTRHQRRSAWQQIRQNPALCLQELHAARTDCLLPLLTLPGATSDIWVVSGQYDPLFNFLRINDAVRSLPVKRRVLPEARHDIHFWPSLAIQSLRDGLIPLT